MLKQIGSDIWTMNGPNIVFAGASMHTRMTIVRLQDKTLWVHSPIEYTPEARQAIAELEGTVVALVAPNKFHHLFVQQWKEVHPAARVFAESTLKAKISYLEDADEITNIAPDLYSQCIDQIVVGGNRLFQEAVFFHRTSKTLILTDLMINLRPEGIKFLPRLFLRFEGALFPNGGIPRLYRLFTRDKAEARKALAVIRSWAPERLTFCHGEPFTESADRIIQSEFRWLD